MYSDADLDAAVAAGVLTHADARALRDFVSAERASPAVDEEHFRLLTGFNDIFVSIAILLVLVAVSWLAMGAAAGFVVAAVSWGLAEYFTRRRRMALPSIILLIAFVLGLFGSTAQLLFHPLGQWNWLRTDWSAADAALRLSAAAAVATGGAVAHWRRFHVPITVAAGAAAGVALALSLLLALLPPLREAIRPLLLVAGLAVFALAMLWDMSDPARETRRADVAFWLHLLAAPLIVHPVFGLLGLFAGNAGAGRAIAVLALYVVLGLVALAIDRRALMVSALAYVLYALSYLFREAGGGLSLAFTALLIGSLLLTLSAFWHGARASIVTRLPDRWQARLPRLGRPAPTPPPA